MKTTNLNENQKLIVEGFINELSRINNPEKKTSFSLINVDELRERNQEVKKEKELCESIKNTWENLRRDEAIRVRDLLREDLPEYPIEVGKDLNSTYIWIGQRGVNVLVEDYHHRMTLQVNLFVIEEKRLEGGTKIEKAQIIYSYYFGNDTFNYSTIEELVSANKFKQVLREKILTT